MTKDINDAGGVVIGVACDVGDCDTLKRQPRRSALSISLSTMHTASGPKPIRSFLRSSSLARMQKDDWEYTFRIGATAIR
ncbi:hypothetical protein [Aquisediminimonas sediminicola]|uniref:hypothetical protein n=1 Tax=Alteraquisediminimonas sediminicola TaxID=2676787 RepID=UPI001C8D37BA|nr:hypothetical protein [Aquisediminimonas sediminicola]